MFLTHSPSDLMSSKVEEPLLYHCRSGRIYLSFLGQQHFIYDISKPEK